MPPKTTVPSRRPLLPSPTTATATAPSPLRAVSYYFHDDGTDFQVPARAVHHAEQALVHLKLALDVARQLHLIS